MPVFGSKGDVSKKDMNFFSEFTEKAAKMARMLAYGVIAIIAVVGVMLILVIMAFAQNAMVKNDISKIKKELKDEKYATVDADFNKLQAEITEKTQYIYALGEMTNLVDSTPTAKVALTDTLKKSIPNEAVVDSYSISGTLLTIQGRTFNYYSAAEFVNFLEKSNVFTSVPQLTTQHYDVEDVLDEQTMTVNTINTYYTFAIQGTLTNDIHITVKRFVEGDTVTAIGQTEIGVTTDGNYLVPGDQYSFDSINEATQGAITYKLSYILINGVRVSDEDFQEFTNNNAISGIASADTTISLYYVQGGEA